MKLTPWMLTVAAFMIVALLAVGFIFKKLTAREVVAEVKPEVRTLPMASSDIEPGTLITRAHLANAPWQDRDLEPDTFLNADAIVGRIAREKITRATPLRGSQFYGPGDRPDLEVGPGMRAITVNVGDDTAMVNGLIKPGQYVDVHMTVDQTNSGAQRNRRFGQDAMTLTLFEGVKVVALNRSYTQSSVDRGHNVTLELDKKQAQIMILASQKGDIALTFNPAGPGRGGVSVQSDEDRVTLQQLLGIPDEQEKKRPFMTEHYRNGGRGAYFFDEDGNRVGQFGDVQDDAADTTPLHSGNGGDWTTSTDKPDGKNMSAVTNSSRAAAL